jgi:septal ring-binding cell division protein DamX
MLIKTRIFGVSLCAFSLSACMLDGSSGYTNYYQPSQNTQLYPDSYETTNYNYNPPIESEHKVVVPETYHVGAYHSPASPKDMDRNWVNSQSPQGYTIELTNGEKPAQVAGVLSKAPKTERTAEVKYNNGGYAGLYGTYPTQEAAQQALSALPDDIKKDAGVKSWSNVQEHVTE